jgi:regulator of replication initiation timing
MYCTFVGNAVERKTKTSDGIEDLSREEEEEEEDKSRNTQRSNPNKQSPLVPQHFPSDISTSSSASTGISGSDTTSDSGTSSASVRVVVRSRPMNSFEKTRGDAHVFRFDNTTNNNSLRNKNNQEMQVVTNIQNGRELIRPFQFDLCASERLDQAHFFQHCGVKNLLDSVLQGYFATVFAYGQTGSGKTYSMSGLEELIGGLNGKKPHSHNSHSRSSTGSNNTQNIPSRSSTEPTNASSSSNGVLPDFHDGIIPRSIKYLYSQLAQINEKKQDMQYSIRASYCEIYNEHVYDLLNPSSGSLHVRFNDRDGFYLQDQVVVQCDTIDEVMAVVSEGHKNRRVGIHEMNKDSSRSHSIMTIYIDIIPKSKTSKGLIAKRMGKISFVDLAGSERLKETKSLNTEETSNINKSLLTLGKVISALALKTTTSPNFIPYRDSKLTKLLMDSLGGNTLTLMIACVSPSSYALEETLSTLNYATRAKNIQNKPTIQVDAVEASMASLRRKNLQLKEENESLKKQLGRHRHQQNDQESPMDEHVLPGSKEQSILPPLIGANVSPTKKIHQGHSGGTPDANWRNQVQILQEENSKLVQQVRTIESHLKHLELENRKLQSQVAQGHGHNDATQHQAQAQAQIRHAHGHGHSLRRLYHDRIEGDEVEISQESSLTRAQKEIHYLKKQIGQLQDREQELMQALVSSLLC